MTTIPTATPTPGLALLNGQVYIPPTLKSFTMDDYRQFYIESYPFYLQTAAASACKFYQLLDNKTYTHLLAKCALTKVQFQALTEAEQIVHFEKVVAKAFDETSGILEALKKTKMGNSDLLDDFLTYNEHFDYVIHLASHFPASAMDAKTTCKQYLNGLSPRIREKVMGKEWTVISLLRKKCVDVVEALEKSATMLHIDLNNVGRAASTTSEEKVIKTSTSQSVKAGGSSTPTPFQGCRRCASMAHKAFQCPLDRNVECSVCHQRGHTAAAHAKFYSGSTVGFAGKSPSVPAPVAHSATSLPSTTSAPFMTPTKVKPTHMRFSAEQARKMTADELEAYNEERKQLLVQLQAEASIIKEVKKEKRIQFSAMVLSSSMSTPPALDSEDTVVDDPSSLSQHSVEATVVWKPGKNTSPR